MTKKMLRIEKNGDKVRIGVMIKKVGIEKNVNGDKIIENSGNGDAESKNRGNDDKGSENKGNDDKDNE